MALMEVKEVDMGCWHGGHGCGSWHGGSYWGPRASRYEDLERPIGRRYHGPWMSRAEATNELEDRLEALRAQVDRVEAQLRDLRTADGRPTEGP